MGDEYIRGVVSRYVLAKEGKKTYVNDFSELPEGANLKEGPQEGYYYHPESVETFQQEIEANAEEIREENNFSQEQVQAAEAERKKYTDSPGTEFEDVLNINPDITVGGSHRVKSTASVMDKVWVRTENDYDSPEDLDDMLGIMAIAKSHEDVQALGESIKEHYGEENVIGYKDYVENPKGFYRAVHVITENEEGYPIEIQVKSPEMKEITGTGHYLTYKNVPNYDEAEQTKISDCLQDVMDKLFDEIDQLDCTEFASEQIAEYRSQDE